MPDNRDNRDQSGSSNSDLVEPSELSNDAQNEETGSINNTRKCDTVDKSNVDKDLTIQDDASVSDKSLASQELTSTELSIVTHNCQICPKVSDEN